MVVEFAVYGPEGTYHYATHSTRNPRVLIAEQVNIGTVTGE